MTTFFVEADRSVDRPGVSVRPELGESAGKGQGISHRYVVCDSPFGRWPHAAPLDDRAPARPRLLVRRHGPAPASIHGGRVSAREAPSTARKSLLERFLILFTDVRAGEGSLTLLMSLNVFLLLTANFQSLRLALVTVSTVPAVVAGVALMLLVTRTTLNIQSFIGAIMAVGVAMANAILLVTFAEHSRRNAVSAAPSESAGTMQRVT